MAVRTAPPAVAPPARGRPRGLNINPVALEELAQIRGMDLTDLAERSGVSLSHLSEAIHKAKGLSLDYVNSLATTLRCRPETIAPTLTHRFTAIRGEAA